MIFVGGCLRQIYLFLVVESNKQPFALVGVSWGHERGCGPGDDGGL